MKVKAYAGNKIEMHRIAGTEKYGITFSCILYDIYSEEQSKKIDNQTEQIKILEQSLQEQIQEKEVYMKMLEANNE